MRTRSSSSSAAVGRTAFALSAVVVVASVVACLTALVTPGLIHGPSVMVGSMRGTALVMLVLGVPMLAVALWRATDASPLPIVAWIAGLVFLTYQAWMFLFAVPFNGLFLVYVVMLAAGFWALVVRITRLDAEALVPPAGPRTPARLLAGWMVASCVAFYGLWLRNVIPSLFASETPAFLQGTGMVTATNYVLDMAFFLPFTIVAAVALWRRTAWGVVVGGAMLVVLTLESVAIAVDQWAGAAADPASTVASAAVTPMFLVIAAVGAVMTWLWYRGVTGAERERENERERSASPRRAPAAGRSPG